MTAKKLNHEIELELTYLAAALPEEINGVEPVEIIDVLIPEDAYHPCLRIRKKGEKLEITKKHPVEGRDSSKQIEITIPLRKDEYQALIKCSNRTFRKYRYYVKIDGHPAEVDVYKDKLQGLVVIDFEFSTETEKDSFVKPKICLVDVTQEEFVAGGMLAGKSYKDIEAKLSKFGYRRLS